MQTIQQRVESQKKTGKKIRKDPDRMTYRLGETVIDRIEHLTIFAGQPYSSHFLKDVIGLFSDIEGPFDIRNLEIRPKAEALDKAA